MEFRVSRVLLIAVCLLVAQNRAAVTLRDASRLWPTSVIKFDFHDNVDDEARDTVVQTLRDIQGKTCLGFIYSRGVETGLLFQADLGRCYKTRIGYRGPGVHSIYVNRDCPGSIPLRSQIFHEVGHALGLVDEYNRPDRNQYLRVRLGNVSKSNRTLFNKMRWEKVDPLEHDFDRYSVMQYGSAFLSRNGGETISSQSNLGLNPVTILSGRDAESLMMMYRCRFKSQSMRLSLEVVERERLQDDVLVNFEVTDIAHGRFPPIHRSSGAPRGSGRVKLPGPINFDVGSWLALKIRVHTLDKDAAEVFIPYSRWQIREANQVVKLCRTPYDCSSSVSVRIISEPATNYCSPKVCSPHGTCRSGDTGPICTCPHGFYGDRCQRMYGSLKVLVQLGSNLRQLDAGTASDPFVRVRANKEDGTYLEKKTRTIMDNANPVWDETLDFGVDYYRSITLDVFDDNSFIYPQPIIENEQVFLKSAAFTMEGTPVAFKMYDHLHPTPSQSFVGYQIVFTGASDN